MYFRLLTSLCERSLYRTSSNVTAIWINRLNHIAVKNEKKQEMEYVSRFPDYTVIYSFPYIKHASIINLIKHRITKLIVVTAPVIIGLYLTDIVSFDTAGSSIVSGILVTMWLHSLGILCNNLIGHVYIKSDKQKIIFSYVNYWGKRIDMETTINDIIPISDNPISITDPLYKKVMFLSRKQKLKINTKLGQISDMNNFKYILGTF